jgi:hypothetical protein
MPASQLSLVIVSLFIGGVPFLLGFNFLEDMDHSIFTYCDVAFASYVITGQLIFFAKEIEPELSDKIKEDKVDVWWGLYCYYCFLFWPTYLGKK